jgi:hypothetical protein
VERSQCEESGEGRDRDGEKWKGWGVEVLCGETGTMREKKIGMRKWEEVEREKTGEVGWRWREIGEVEYETEGERLV